jgi:hypothetical protein
MKSMIFGLAMLGLAGTGAAQAAPPPVQKVQYYEHCDQHCQEHRREEAREREHHEHDHY